MTRNAPRLLIVAFLLTGLMCAAAQSSDVPVKYRDLYAELEQSLAAAEQRLPAAVPDSASPVLAVELTAANANRGPVLLAPRTRAGVKANLDAFQKLGVFGVTVAASYPILAKDFPRSDEYLDFYRFVVDEARSRHLKILIKAQDAFTDAQFGQLGARDYYRKLGADGYARDKRDMIERILRELQPDSLTIENEPDTAKKNTGLDFSPDRYIANIRAMLQGLDRGKTRIGAGAGSWSPSVYFERLAAETEIDYLDVHVYPVNREFLAARLDEVAALAKRYHKGLTVGEAWLYKIRESELGRGDFSWGDIYARDIFAFWAPLDTRFIDFIGHWARANHADSVSFFWVQYLFGYVKYEPALEAKSAAELQALGTQTAVPKIVRQELSPTGEALRALIARSPAGK
jgi:hypothetical protein